MPHATTNNDSFNNNTLFASHEVHIKRRRRAYAFLLRYILSWRYSTNLPELSLEDHEYLIDDTTNTIEINVGLIENVAALLEDVADFLLQDHTLPMVTRDTASANDSEASWANNELSRMGVHQPTETTTVQ